jgi:hypothetical protein
MDGFANAVDDLLSWCYGTVCTDYSVMSATTNRYDDTFAFSTGELLTDAQTDACGGIRCSIRL